MNVREAARIARLDAWLARGGRVVASSERLARALAGGYAAARRLEGQMAWATPAIGSWEQWVRGEWQARNGEGRMLLNGLQEQELWAEAIRTSGVGSSLLRTDRLAAAAQRAYGLLCRFAPEFLETRRRAGWLGDAASFSVWMEGFTGLCREHGVMSASRLVEELALAVSGESEPGRMPVLLVGFDRLLPSQRSLLKAWGEWKEDFAQFAEDAGARFLWAEDEQAELDACLGWLRGRLAEDPAGRILVIATDLARRRGMIERTFLREQVRTAAAGEPALRYEFSLGSSLAEVGLVRGALMLLRWMLFPLTEAEVDWLLGSGLLAATEDEYLAVSRVMVRVREAQLERPEWTLAEFCAAAARFGAQAWSARMKTAQVLLGEGERLTMEPVEWVPAVEETLTRSGWPGFRPLGSEAFQARERWQGVLETAASLGFSRRGMTLGEFTAVLGRAAATTIFAAESSDAAVLITEPLESAGLVADGVWFLGADEESWPGNGQANALIPLGVQREAGMPYADPQADWGLAQAVTRRVRDGVRGAIFSYARRVGGLEMGASRLMLQELGEATKMPEAWRRWAAEEEALTEEFADGSEVAYPLSALRGGAAALTWQSNCAFKAFGLARLAAERREAAEAGLSARERGNLLHAVLHRVWGGRATSGTVSLAELQAVADWPAAEEQESRAKLAAFVRPHARAVLEGENRRLGERLLRFPLSFRELEVERLTVLVTEWLMLECERQPFRVAETEVGRRVKASGLDLQLRLDRIDELDGGRRLVVDYKTGDAKPAMWKAESPEDRPEDVQLPLYAVFAQDFANEADLEGLVLAKVRPGKMEFAGRMRDARAALLPGLASAAGLVKDPLTDGQLAVWREVIERLGREFGQGVAAVDPKDPRKTCEACHLHAVCRIYEQRSLAAMVAGDGEDGEGADGEGGDE